MLTEKRTRKLQFYLIVFTFLIITFSSIGFSALSSSLTLTGNLTYVVPETVVLSEVKLLGSANGATGLITPTHTDDSAKIMVNVSATGSTISYQFTFVNNASVDMKISSFSSSAGNLSYKVTNGDAGTRIGAGETITIYITFECLKEGSCSSSGVTSNLKFTFSKYNVSYLMRMPFSSSSNFPISSDKIESIRFEEYRVPASNDSFKAYWDVSENQDKSILAWISDTDSDGLYEISIGSKDGMVYANPNSSYLFSGLTSLSSIDFTRFDTSMVTNMQSMFGAERSPSATITPIDPTAPPVVTQGLISPTPDIGVSSGCNLITALNISQFNTANVTNMKNMFYGCSKLMKIDFPNKFYDGQVTSYTGVFFGMPVSAKLRVYGDKTKSWILGLGITSRPAKWSDSNFISLS